MSLRTLAIFAAMGTASVAMVAQGWTQIYFDIADVDWGLGGWGYWTLTLLVLIVLHDTWFYWAHRAMHHPRLFRRFHKPHHKFHNPTPWAAYAFAPGEAVVQAAFPAIMIFVMPLHPSVIGVFMLHQVVRNVIGHSGFEIYPRGMATHPIGKWITPPTHHDLHHSKVTGNYALYFTWWDRWMGTLRDDYEATYQAVTSREPGEQPSNDPLSQLPEHRRPGSTSTVATATPAP